MLRHMRNSNFNRTCRYCFWSYPNLAQHQDECPLNIKVQCHKCKSMISQSQINQHRNTCLRSFRIRQTAINTRPHQPVRVSRSENHIQQNDSDQTIMRRVQQQLFSLIKIQKQKKIIKSPGIRLSKNSNQICSICLSKLIAGNFIRRMPCKHQFHQKCVDQWLLKKSTCPNCRKVID